MRLHSLLAWTSAGVLATALASFACSSSSDDKTTSTPAGDDSSTADDTAADDTAGDDAVTGDDAPATDASTATVNGCTTFEDKTAEANPKVLWANPLSQGEPLCWKLKKGQTVEFEVTGGGTFATHPLDPKGGDTTTPITKKTADATASFVFDKVGTFGFVCDFHSNMAGAFQVTE